VLLILTVFLYDVAQGLKNAFFDSKKAKSKLAELSRYYQFAKFLILIVFLSKRKNTSQEKSLPLMASLKKKFIHFKKLLLLLPDFWNEFVLFIRHEQKSAETLFTTTLLDDILDHSIIFYNISNQHVLLLICKTCLFLEHLSQPSDRPNIKKNARLFVSHMLSLLVGSTLNVLDDTDLIIPLSEKSLAQTHRDHLKKDVLPPNRAEKIQKILWDLENILKRNQSYDAKKLESLFLSTSILIDRLLALEKNIQNIYLKKLISSFWKTVKIYDLKEEFLLILTPIVLKRTDTAIACLFHGMEKYPLDLQVSYFMKSYLYLDLMQAAKEHPGLIIQQVSRVLIEILKLKLSTLPFLIKIFTHIIETYDAQAIKDIVGFALAGEHKSLILLIQPVAQEFFKDSNDFHTIKILLTDLLNSQCKVKNPWYFSQLIIELMSDCSSQEQLFMLSDQPKERFTVLNTLLAKLKYPSSQSSLTVFHLYTAEKLPQLEHQAREHLLCLWLLHHSNIIIYNHILFSICKDEFLTLGAEKIRLLEEMSSLSVESKDLQKKLLENTKKIFALLERKKALIESSIVTLSSSLHTDIVSILNVFKVEIKDWSTLLSLGSEFVFKTIPLSLHYNRSCLKNDYVRQLAGVVLYHRYRSYEEADQLRVSSLSSLLIKKLLDDLATPKILTSLGSLIKKEITPRIQMIFFNTDAHQLQLMIHALMENAPKEHSLVKNVLLNSTDSFLSFLATHKISLIAHTLLSDEAILSQLNEHAYTYIASLTPHDFSDLLKDLSKNDFLNQLPLDHLLRKLRTSCLKPQEVKMLKSVILSIIEITDDASMVTCYKKAPSLLTNSFFCGFSAFQLARTATLFTKDFFVEKTALLLSTKKSTLVRTSLSSLSNKIYEDILMKNPDFCKIDDAFSIEKNLALFNQEHPVAYDLLHALFSSKKQTLQGLKKTFITFSVEYTLEEALENFSTTLTNFSLQEKKLPALRSLNLEQLPSSDLSILVGLYDQKKRILVSKNLEKVSRTKLPQ
jgi:hypothetical protein